MASWATLEAVSSLRAALGQGFAVPADLARCVDELCANMVAIDMLSDPAMVKVAKTSAQCVANLAARGEVRAVWRGLFERRGDGAAVVELGLASPAVRRYVAAAVLACVRRDGEYAEALASDARTVAELVDNSLNCKGLRDLAGVGGASEEEGDDEAVELAGDAEWLYLLLRGLFARRGVLVALFAAATAHEDARLAAMRGEFIVALALAAARDGGGGGDGDDSDDDDLASEVLEVACVEIGNSVGTTRSMEASSSSSSSTEKEEEEDDDTRTMGRRATCQTRSIALQVVAERSARFSGVVRHEALVAAGALDLAAAVLRAGPKMTLDGDAVAALALVANISHDTPKARDAARETGLIPLVLNRCSIDDRNPLQREWAVFAVRSLTTDNEANREFIASLSAQGVGPHNATLEAAGVEALHLDEATQRPVLTRRKPRQRRPRADALDDRGPS